MKKVEFQSRDGLLMTADYYEVKEQGHAALVPSLPLQPRRVQMSSF